MKKLLSLSNRALKLFLNKTFIKSAMIIFCVGFFVFGLGISRASAATAIYRSVSYGDTSNHNTNNATVTISGTAATFSTDMPDNIGVGDVLQYNISGTYHLAFISGRTSSTVYTVQSSTGTTPQAATAGQAVGVYRAYTNINNAVSQTGNSAIDSSVRSFGVGTNLVSSDIQLYWSVYVNGASSYWSPQTISGFTSDSTHYITLYAPYISAEVGASQRHDTYYSNTYSYLYNNTALAAPLLTISTDYTRVKGLQFSSSTSNNIALVNNTASGVVLDGNILKASNGTVITGIQTNGNDVLISNNSIFNFAGYGINDVGTNNGTTNIINNTLYGHSTTGGVGINHSGGSTDTIINTIVGNFNVNYQGVFSTSSGHNISSLIDAPGTTVWNSTTAKFIDGTINTAFNAGLAKGSIAVDQGEDVSSYGVTTDILGNSRPYGSGWDIGCSEWWLYTPHTFIFSDGFDADSSISDLSNDGWLISSGYSLDAMGGIDGTPAVKWVYANSGSNSYAPLTYSVSTYHPNQIYAQFKVKFSADPMGGIKFYKIFGITEDGPSYANWTWNFSPSGVTNSPATFTVLCHGDGSGLANDTIDCLYAGNQTYGGGVTPVATIVTSNPAISPTADTWYTVDFYNKYNTDGNADGEMWMKVNGVTLMHVTNVTNRNDANDPVISKISLGDYGNQYANMTMWIDDVQLSNDPIPDTTAPTITSFVIPSTSTSRTVAVTLTATDDSGTVAGYCLTETNNSSTCSWSASPLTSYTFATDGSKTLYAFAKDATPNISTTSAGSTATTTIDSTPPTLSFTYNTDFGPTQSDIITADWGDATVMEWDYFDTNTCSTTSTDYNNECTVSMDQTTETNNTKYICLYAEDALGNYDTLASTNPINIDITEPTTTINSHPNSVTTSTDATFTFSSNETATFECNLDSAGFTTCTTPKDYTTLAEGSHTFQVKAIDTATNEDATPEEFTWDIDSLPPTLTNLSPNNQTLPNTTTSTNLTLDTNETAVCHYATTDTDFGSMTSFDTTNSTAHSTLITGLNPETSYSYYIKCQDTVTNESESQLTFSIDAVADSTPTLEKIEIKINRTINKFKDTLRLASNKLKFQQKDENLANGQVKIYKGKSLWKTIDINENGEWDKLLKFKDDFSGIIKIRQYDQDGTLLDTTRANIKIDTEKPVFEMPFPTTINISRNQQINLKATDNDAVSYYKTKLLDEKGHIQKNWRKQNRAYYFIPKDVPNGNYTLIVRAYDRVGNYQEEITMLNVGTEAGTQVSTSESGQTATDSNAQPASGLSADAAETQGEVNVKQESDNAQSESRGSATPMQENAQGNENNSVWWKPWTWF